MPVKRIPVNHLSHKNTAFYKILWERREFCLVTFPPFARRVLHDTKDHGSNLTRFSESVLWQDTSEP